MNPCAECHRTVGADGRPLDAVLIRLVRDAQGTECPWGTTEKTIAPHARVCTLCLALLPRHDPLASGDRGVVATRPPLFSEAPLSKKKRQTDKVARAVFATALRDLPPGEAVYGWPYGASCYLVGERLFAEKLPKTRAVLHGRAETARAIEAKFKWYDRLWRLLARKWR